MTRRAMRVLHIINGLSLGGAELMLHRLLSATDRARFDPVVLSLTGDGPVGERIRALDVPVHTVRLRPGVSTPRAAWHLLRLLRQLDPDVIQAWQYHANLVSALARPFLRRRVPLLWNIRHSIYDLRAERRLSALVVTLGARLCARADAVIYVARISALQHEALGYRADRRIVLGNGFDVERLAPSDRARRDLRRELGLPPSALLIGKIARYHPLKDHTTFLRGAAHLQRAHPEVHFVMAGQGVDGANGELTARVSELGLRANTHLLGPREDVHRLTAGLDIATSASSSEAFPNVVAEAMACGVPCVATDVGDAAAILGGLGQLVPPGQPQALAQAWARLIDLGEEGRRVLGLEARRRIVEHYSLPSIVTRYERLYADVCEHPAAVRAPRARAHAGH